MSIEMFDPETGQLAMSTKDLVARHPSVTLGGLIPGLRALGSTQVPNHDFPTRLRIRMPSFAACDLADTKVAEMLAMPQVGETSVRPFIEQLNELVSTMGLGGAAEDQWCQSCGGQMIAVTGAWRRSAFGDEWLESVEVTSAILAREMGIETVGDLLAVDDRLGDIPMALQDSVEAIMAAPLSSLSIPEVGELIEDFLEPFTERDVRIATGRLWTTNPLTLEEVGTECDLTRERVRQLQNDITQRAQLRVEDPRFLGLRVRAELLRARLGCALPVGHETLHSALGWATRDVRDELRPLTGELLMWLAGPYEEVQGWVACDRSALPQSPNAIAGLLNSGGFATEHELSTHLRMLGLIEPVHASWVSENKALWRIQGHVIDASGAITDLAARYLSLVGEPLSTTEILAGLGTEKSIRATKNRLMEDPRFIRTTKENFGLSEWDLERYTTVKDLMEAAITEAGGALPLEDLVEQLVDRFSISRASIRMIAERPMFRRDRDLVMLRTEEYPYVVKRDVEAARGAYATPTGMLHLRFEVNGDLLRGSGLAVHEAIAGWLGVAPGDEVVLYGEDGIEIRFMWKPWASPEIGSLRPLQRAAGAAQGDYLVLRFNGDRTFTSIHVTTEDVAHPTWIVIAKVLGLDEETVEEAQVKIAELLGVDEPDADLRRFKMLRAASDQRDFLVEGLTKQVVYS